MSISLFLSPPLRTLLSYSCNLLLAFWGSALQTALGTKCCPCPCRQEGVTCAIPNLPTPLCVNNLLKPPFFGSKAVSFHTLCLFQLFVIYQVCLPGRKRRCVMGSCCVQGEKETALWSAGLLVWNGKFPGLSQIFQVSSQLFHPLLSCWSLKEGRKRSYQI